MTTYKTNPWLVSTVLLLGLILGYAGALLGSGVGFELPGLAPAGPVLQLPAAAALQGIPQSLTKEGYPVLGNLAAKLTLTEYSDFQCPYCERFATSANPPAAYPQIVQTYLKTGQAKLIFRNFPLPFHPNAPAAAEAALCAGAQNKFWQYHDALFLNQKIWENDPAPAATFTRLAKQLDLDKSDFKACLEGKKFTAHVQADLQAGMQAGVEGTPTIFVDKTPVVGAQPFAVFQEAIEAALNPKAAVTPAAAETAPKTGEPEAADSQSPTPSVTVPVTDTAAKK